MAHHQVYGEDIAILSGDALLTYAFEHIARATQGVPADRVLRVRGWGRQRRGLVLTGVGGGGGQAYHSSSGAGQVAVRW
jgi:hypothetical protein